MAIKYNPEDCGGCGNCLESCVGKAFTTNGKFSIEFNSDLCLQCDECEAYNNCLCEALEYV